MNKDFFFVGPDGTPHSFTLQDFKPGSTPSTGSILCDCGNKHSIFHNKFEHGVRLGYIKPADNAYEDHRTHIYYFSFVEEKVREEFPGSTKL